MGRRLLFSSLLHSGEDFSGSWRIGAHPHLKESLCVAEGFGFWQIAEMIMAIMPRVEFVIITLRSGCRHDDHISRNGSSVDYKFANFAQDLLAITG